MLKLKKESIKTIFNNSKDMLLDFQNHKFDEEKIFIEQRKMYILLQLASFGVVVVNTIQQGVLNSLKLINNDHGFAHGQCYFTPS